MPNLLPMSPLSGSAGRRTRGAPMLPTMVRDLQDAPTLTQGPSVPTHPMVPTGPRSTFNVPVTAAMGGRRVTSTRNPHTTPSMIPNPSGSGGGTGAPTGPLMTRPGGMPTAPAPTFPMMSRPAPSVHGSPILENARRARQNANAATEATKKPNVPTQGRSFQIGESAAREMWLNTAKKSIQKFTALGQKYGFDSASLLDKWAADGTYDGGGPEGEYKAVGERPGTQFPAKAPDEFAALNKRRTGYAADQNFRADELEAAHTAMTTPPKAPPEPEDPRIQVAKINQDGLNNRAKIDGESKAKQPTSSPNDIGNTAAGFMRDPANQMSPSEALAMAKFFHSAGPDPRASMPVPPLTGGNQTTIGGTRVGPATQPTAETTPAGQPATTQPSGGGSPVRGWASLLQDAGDGTKILPSTGQRYRRAENGMGWEEIQ